MTIKKRIYHLIGKKTPEERIRERIRIIKELVEENLEEEYGENHGQIDEVKKEFYLDGLTVADENGEILHSNGAEDDFKELIDETGLMKQITEKMPETKMLTIRNNGSNHILYNEDEKVYFMKTPGTVSTFEIRRIAQKINGEE